MGARSLARLVVRPIGHALFVTAMLVLALAAELLGDDHELGYFSSCISRRVWRYPEVTRRGFEVIAAIFLVLAAVAFTPPDIDGLSPTGWGLGWDGLAYLAIAIVAARRAGLLRWSLKIALQVIMWTAIGAVFVALAANRVPWDEFSVLPIAFFALRYGGPRGVPSAA
jgi:hypothetical protein